SGSPLRKVLRSDELRLPRDVVKDLLLVPDMVARGHRVDAVAEDRVGEVAGDGEAGGRALDGDNDEVDPLALDQRGNGAARALAPGLTEDVANEKDAHARREPGSGSGRRVARRAADSR